MFDWYQRYLVDTGRSATLWVLIGFVVTYTTTRWITLRIRARTTRHTGRGLVVTSIGVAFHISYTIICLLKGKIATGLISLPVPLIALVGAIRLAKPSSFWARRFYSGGRLARSQERFGDSYLARRERLRDRFSGGR